MCYVGEQRYISICRAVKCSHHHAHLIGGDTPAVVVVVRAEDLSQAAIEGKISC